MLFQNERFNNILLFIVSLGVAVSSKSLDPCFKFQSQLDDFMTCLVDNQNDYFFCESPFYDIEWVTETCDYTLTLPRKHYTINNDDEKPVDTNF